MTLKNTDQASAKLIRLEFNMLVLTIQDDLVGLYGHQKNLAFTLSKKNILALNLLKKQHGFLAEETKMVLTQNTQPLPPKKPRSLI